MPAPEPGNPLTLSIDLRLDLALRGGIETWEAAVADRRATATAKWIMQRSAGSGLDPELVIEAIENLLLAEDPADRALARAEVGEMVQESDPELADLLWFAVRDFAMQSRRWRPVE